MNAGSLITLGHSIHAEPDPQNTTFSFSLFCGNVNDNLHSLYQISCSGGGTMPRHLHMLGATQLESSLAEKGLGVLVETKLNMCPCCKKVMVIWAASGGVLPAGQGS